jgi:predicted component of type VI protein secretion system
MAVQYRLVVKAGPDEGRLIEINKPLLIIGRDPAADIQINDPEISRKHAKITNQGGPVTIEDLGSTNGTFVNNARIAGPYHLRPGEIIYLGEHVTLLFEQNQDVDVTVASPVKYAGGPPPLQGYSAPVKNAVPYISPEPIPQQPPLHPEPVQNPAYPNQPQQGFNAQPSAPIKKKLPRWVVILIIVAILIVIFCVLPLIIVDSFKLWCSGFLGSIMRAISPGSCPIILP